MSQPPLSPTDHQRIYDLVHGPWRVYVQRVPFRVTVEHDRGKPLPQGAELLGDRLARAEAHRLAAEAIHKVVEAEALRRACASSLVLCDPLPDGWSHVEPADPRRSRARDWTP